MVPCFPCRLRFAVLSFVTILNVLILVVGEIEQKAILETDAVLVLARMLKNAQACSRAAYYLPMLADHCLSCLLLFIQSIDTFILGDFRAVISRTGAVTDLVKMLHSNENSVRDEAATSLISLAEHGSFFMPHQCPVRADRPVGEFEKAILETEAILVLAKMLKDVNSDTQTRAALFLAKMADHGLSIH
jgi:hypothetical protein